jgi:hypothetical protein
MVESVKSSYEAEHPEGSWRAQAQVWAALFRYASYSWVTMLVKRKNGLRWTRFAEAAFAAKGVQVAPANERAAVSATAPKVEQEVRPNETEAPSRRPQRRFCYVNGIKVEESTELRCGFKPSPRLMSCWVYPESGTQLWSCLSCSGMVYPGCACGAEDWDTDDTHKQRRVVCSGCGQLLASTGNAGKVVMPNSPTNAWDCRCNYSIPVASGWFWNPSNAAMIDEVTGRSSNDTRPWSHYTPSELNSRVCGNPTLRAAVNTALEHYRNVAAAVEDVNRAKYEGIPSVTRKIHRDFRPAAPGKKRGQMAPERKPGATPRAERPLKRSPDGDGWITVGGSKSGAKKVRTSEPSINVVEHTLKGENGPEVIKVNVGVVLGEAEDKRPVTSATKQRNARRRGRKARSALEAAFGPNSVGYQLTPKAEALEDVSSSSEVEGVILATPITNEEIEHRLIELRRDQAAETGVQPSAATHSDDQVDHGSLDQLPPPPTDWLFGSGCGGERLCEELGEFVPADVIPVIPCEMGPLIKKTERKCGNPYAGRPVRPISVIHKTPTVIRTKSGADFIERAALEIERAEIALEVAAVAVANRKDDQKVEDVVSEVLSEVAVTSSEAARIVGEQKIPVAMLAEPQRAIGPFGKEGLQLDAARKVTEGEKARLSLAMLPWNPPAVERELTEHLRSKVAFTGRDHRTPKWLNAVAERWFREFDYKSSGWTTAMRNDVTNKAINNVLPESSAEQKIFRNTQHRAVVNTQLNWRDGVAGKKKSILLRLLDKTRGSSSTN